MTSVATTAHDREALDVPPATVVECFGLRLRGGYLLGRRVEVPLRGQPDEVAAEAIGLLGTHWRGVAVLHSTSWRFDRQAHALVLTYLCCPDPDAREDGVVLVQPGVLATDDQGPASADPSRPSPASLSHGTVLHHGIGHLTWLAEHSPELVAGSRAIAPGLWEAIARTAPARAGQVAEAHQIDLPG
jgi:hypothetical protein